MAVEHLDAAPGLGSRYALALLPWRGGSGELPDRALVLDGLRVDTGRLAEYSRVCGFGVDGTLPVTYPQVLSFGLQVRLMTSPGFPLRLPGLVHLRQRMTVHRRLDALWPLDLRVHAEGLRPHPKGAQVDLVTAVTVAGEPAWHGRGTYLALGATAPASAAGSDPEPEPVEGDARAARWEIPADIGRRYAAVSGDVNPIHLNPLAARLFGFPGAIAHGMWTAARTLATLQGRLPDAYEVDVAFRRPVILPSTVWLHTADHGRRLTLRSADSSRVHLVAAVHEVARPPNLVTGVARVGPDDGQGVSGSSLLR